MERELRRIHFFYQLIIKCFHRSIQIPKNRLLINWYIVISFIQTREKLDLLCFNDNCTKLFKWKENSCEITSLRKHVENEDENNHCVTFQPLALLIFDSISRVDSHFKWNCLINCLWKLCLNEWGYDFIALRPSDAIVTKNGKLLITFGNNGRRFWIMTTNIPVQRWQYYENYANEK